MDYIPQLYRQRSKIERHFDGRLDAVGRQVLPIDGIRESVTPLAGKVDDVQQSVDKLSPKVDDVGKQLATASAAIEKVHQEVQPIAAIRDTVNPLPGKLDGVLAAVNGVPPKVDAVGQQVTTAQAAIKAVHGRVDAVGLDLLARLTKVQTTLDGLGTPAGLPPLKPVAAEPVRLAVQALAIALDSTPHERQGGIDAKAKDKGPLKDNVGLAGLRQAADAAAQALPPALAERYRHAFRDFADGEWVGRAARFAELMALIRDIAAV